MLVLCALAAYERRSLPLAAATGAVAGVAILGNARLILLPVALALYLAWRTRFSHAVTAAALVVGMAAIVVVPWVARNKVQVGCYAITTDARALWKANNENTRAVLDRGGWIDDVPELPGAPPWPELAADLTLAGKPTTHRRVRADAALPRRGRRLLARAARREGASRAAGDRDALEPRAARVGRERERNGAPRSQDDRACVHGRSLRAGRRRRLRRPAATSSASPLLMLAYNTLAAMVFAGTARYRTPWDFLLALLAAFALASAWERIQRRRRRHYVGAGSRARA